MRTLLLWISASLAFLMCEKAEARLAIDLSKTTCHRAFFIGTVVSSNSIALWLSGYFSGQHGHGIIDVETLEEDANKIKRYCRSHRDEILINAVKAALGADK